MKRHLIFNRIVDSKERDHIKRDLKEAEDKDAETRNKEREKELEKKEAEEWLLFDQDEKSITELKLEKTVRDKKENRKENIDMNEKMMKENPVTESNESIENKMYDVYIPCFHTPSEDIVTLVRFQTAMAIIGGIAMYMVRKQAIQSLSLFDRRKLQLQENSG